MGRPRRIEVGLVKRAEKAVAHATGLQDLRAAQAVLLPGVLGATLAQTAAVLGVGRATVGRLQAGFRRSAKSRTVRVPRRDWGGRRHALLTLEEETQFLAPWVEQARAGGMLVVSPLRAALAQRLGKPVKASVVYRLLARHGWRKVAPDTRHPKSDPHVQDEWKKNSRTRWRAC